MLQVRARRHARGRPDAAPTHEGSGDTETSAPTAAGRRPEQRRGDRGVARRRRPLDRSTRDGHDEEARASCAPPAARSGSRGREGMRPDALRFEYGWAASRRQRRNAAWDRRRAMSRSGRRPARPCARTTDSRRSARELAPTRPGCRAAPSGACRRQPAACRTLAPIGELAARLPRQARHHAARGVEQVLRRAALRHRREDLVARRHADAAAGLGEQAQQALRVDAAVLGAR